jgi:hypothetical protein
MIIQTIARGLTTEKSDLSGTRISLLQAEATLDCKNVGNGQAGEQYRHNQSQSRCNTSTMLKYSCI